MKEQSERSMGNDYPESVSPEENVEVFDLREEVPDSVPIPDDNIGDEEPDPEEYSEVSQYVHDLLEYVAGFQADQAAVDPANPGQIADNQIALEGDIMEVDVDEYGIEISYRISDKFLNEPEGSVETLEEMPDTWADVESTVTIDYDASSFPELRKKTKKAADYLTEVDRAFSDRRNP
jgi:hypothetical protein